VLKGDTVVDVSKTVKRHSAHRPHDLINGLIERFADCRKKLERRRRAAAGIPVKRVKIRPPLPRPYISTAWRDYMEDGTRSSPPPSTRFTNRQLGDRRRRHHVLPDVPASIFEGEAEMALVIGRRASNVKAANAMKHVFGYVNFIDGSRATCRRRQPLLTR